MVSLVIQMFSIFILVVSKSWGVHITYDGRPITQVSEYELLINEMSTNSRLNEYSSIRSKIGVNSTLLGPLISLHRIVRGAHAIPFDFRATETHLITLNNIFYGLFSITNPQNKPNTDLSFLHIDEVNKGRRVYRPITSLPILERASIEDIRNSENKFYALSCTLHGSNFINNINGQPYTPLLSQYCNVIRCLPTLNDPEFDSVLRFEIDDRNNLPLQFRTAGGDSGQGFFLVTPDNKLKVVGVHNPGNNYFYVENLAYPPTKLFVNDLIAQDAVPEPISMLILGTGTIFYMKKGLFILRIKKFQQ